MARRLAAALVTTACLIASLVVTTSATTVATPTGDGPAPGPVKAIGGPAHHPTHRHTVTLPTGDTVAVTTQPGGRVAARVTPDSPGGLGSMFYTLRMHGQTFVVPADALSDFGSRWDVHDFAVTRDSGPSPAAAKPSYNMRTLTVDIRQLTGQRGRVPFVILNVDHMSKYARFEASPTTDLRRLSVPVGHYCVIAFFTDYNRDTGAYTERIVTAPDVTVPTGSDAKVVLDEHSATRKVQVHTPRPSTRKAVSAMVYRADTAGVGATYGFTMTAADQDIYVKPTRQVRVGQLKYTDYLRLAAPDGSYLYDVGYPTSGRVPADVDHHPTPADLATVDATYTADVPGRSESEQRFSWVRWQTLSVLTAGSRLTTPTQRTEYVIGGHRIDWQQTMTTMSGFR
ncbi:MAG: hypothetical protein ACRDQA_00070, partial [Nocardioidaceae bacterium]